MATYIVSYDLNKPGQYYTKLVERLKSYSNWWHHLGSTWIIVADKTAVELRNELLPFLDTNDELLVVQSSGVGAWHGFNTQGSDWLKINL